MKASFIADNPIAAGTAIIPVFNKGKAYGAAKDYINAMGAQYKKAAKAAGFTGQAGKSFRGSPLASMRPKASLLGG